MAGVFFLGDMWVLFLSCEHSGARACSWRGSYRAELKGIFPHCASATHHVHFPMRLRRGAGWSAVVSKHSLTQTMLGLLVL